MIKFLYTQVSSVVFFESELNIKQYLFYSCDAQNNIL